MSPRYTLTVLLLLLLAPGLARTAHAQLRNVQAGDLMEPFALPTLDGEPFRYDLPRERATVLTFVAAHQKRSERTVEDLVELAAWLERQRRSVDVVFVISGGEGQEYFRALWQRLELGAPLLVDAADDLWGALGVVVTPTTLMVDPKGTIRWIRAGHSYDFAPDARANVERMLEIGGPAADATAAPAVATPADRARRHLRIGQVYGLKGKLDEGIAELWKADALVPDWVPVRLELARLLCRAERPEEALAVAEAIRPTNPEEGARAMMISGWALRQLGELDRALALLSDAVELDPQSSRALFELGKVYEQRGECNRAAETFRRALALELDEAS
ncbi:MAG: tetratricopeptide repeat protein [Planctomycetota bacterium]|jgi:tetratricopeptide (TPR) repeat protein